jgi:Fur family ferric uptake transcriptional regulator
MTWGERAKGRLNEAGFRSGAARRQVIAFERNDPGGHHHHMVCKRCGKLIPFSDPALERAIEGIGERAEFEITAHDVLLRGRCPDCREAS